MADQQINVTDSSIPIFTGQPNMIVRHSISDEELDILCDAATSARSQVISVAIGALIGAAPAALPGLFWLFMGQPQTASTVVQCLIFVGCLAVIGVVLYVTKGQNGKVSRLIKTIRDRVPSSQ